MTTRERPRGRFGPAWDDASLFPDRAGLPWWAAVLLAAGLASAGAFVDLQRINRLGLIFQGCYFLGCLLAIVLVQRKGLFGPMVQPPLILVVAVPGVVLLAGGVPTAATFPAKALSVATPLINGFPTMAITAVLTLGVGVFRLVTQRPPPATARPSDPRARRPRRPPPPSSRNDETAGTQGRDTTVPREGSRDSRGSRGSRGSDSGQPGASRGLMKPDS